ncbi:MAG: DUF1329 domain-containing protein [Myxococcota bacterium]
MRKLAWILGLALAAPALAAERSAQDAVPTTPFKEGDVIGFADLDKLKSYLPPQFWDNHEFFFYEGMQLEIGPSLRKYGAADAYDAATEKNKGRAKIGQEGALVDYAAGQPFPNASIDCKGDPDSGTKIIWNFIKAWNGDGAAASWSYTYWDRGEQLPLYYEGTSRTISLANRVEPQYAQNDGDIFPSEKRQNAFGIEVDAPFDARGIQVLTYRYKSADGPLQQMKNDDTWVYVPDLRRVRRISSAQRTDSVQGTDFTMDDLRSFSGIPPQYKWQCLGEQTVIAPTNTKTLAYPYSDTYNFGPYGFSYASDRWEVRKAWIIRFTPKNEDHPYNHKDIYIDQETYEPLYSFAYDRKDELWKIIWHNHRYSEDWNGKVNRDPKAGDGVWYAGWEGVPEPKDLRTVSDIIVNVQTGTGNRIEFWNNEGTPLETKGKMRVYIDIGRLNRGR